MRKCDNYAKMGVTLLETDARNTFAQYLKTEKNTGRLPVFFLYRCFIECKIVFAVSSTALLETSITLQSILSTTC